MSAVSPIFVAFRALLPSRPSRAVAAATLVALALPACGDGEPGASGRGSAGATAAASGTANPPSSSSAAKPSKPEPPPAAQGVDVLKMQLTSEVKSREPIDKLESAKPGQRVYAHVTARNRTTGTQKLTVSFRVNDQERSSNELTVEKSWSWRTWAYVTLQAKDKGELTVHVFDDHGAELATESIPIK